MQILLQKQTRWNQDVFFPFDPDSVEALKELKENQPITCTIKELGAKKARSVAQFNLFHAALRVVAANSEEPNWSTLARAKLSLKVALNYIDQDSAVVRPNGEVVLNYRSFSFSALQSMEANRIFDRGFEYLAGVIGVTVEELLKNAQNREY